MSFERQACMHSMVSAVVVLSCVCSLFPLFFPILFSLVLSCLVLLVRCLTGLWSLCVPGCLCNFVLCRLIWCAALLRRAFFCAGVLSYCVSCVCFSFRVPRCCRVRRCVRLLDSSRLFPCAALLLCAALLSCTALLSRARLLLRSKLRVLVLLCFREQRVLLPSVSSSFSFLLFIFPWPYLFLRHFPNLHHYGHGHLLLNLVFFLSRSFYRWRVGGCRVSASMCLHVNEWVCVLVSICVCTCVFMCVIVYQTHIKRIWNAYFTPI